MQEKERRSSNIHLLQQNHMAIYHFRSKHFFPEVKKKILRCLKKKFRTQSLSIKYLKKINEEEKKYYTVLDNSFIH